jgi:hypothetical protein
MNIMRVASFLAGIIMWLAVGILGYLVFQKPDLSGVLFLGFAVYLLLPIKHPCDYKSYKSWWSDRSNWGMHVENEQEIK